VPNFAGALKGEIQRLARKEVRASVTPLKKLVAALRRRVAQQKRQMAELERTAKRSMKHGRAAAEAPEREGSQIRFSPQWVKKHRKKLNMSRRLYANLVGVSAQTIFGWETGRARPRRGALESWRRIRSMGKRELKGMTKAESDGRRGKAAKRGRKTKRGRPAAGRKRGRAALGRKRGRAVARRRGRPAASRKRRVAARGAARRSGMRRAAKKQ
jgi:DNA-binding transcriptional regulator YiaG